MTPGGIVPGYPFEPVQNLNDTRLNPEDEALLGDPAADTIPHELIEQLGLNAKELLGKIFDDTRTQSILLGMPKLDWIDAMPLNSQGSAFIKYPKPLVSISRKKIEGESEKVNLEFDFSDEDITGKLEFTYQDEEIRVDTIATNEYGETITTRDDIKKPLPHILRMGLFIEALGFFQNEREYRRDMPLSDFRPNKTISEEI